jgi:hypothetical protein
MHGNGGYGFKTEKENSLKKKGIRIVNRRVIMKQFCPDLMA